MSKSTAPRRVTATNQAQSLAQPALVCGVLVAIAAISLQLFDVEYPMLADLPNHLARHAIQCAGDQPGGLNDYYQFQLRVVPNLAADLVYAFDLACRNIYLTNRVLIQVSILNLVASVFVLHYALWRRLSLWPAASSLLAYNQSFSSGFENFSLAAPFALYGLAAWAALSEKGTFVRLAIMAPFAAGVYVLHVLIFGFLLVSIAGWELGRSFVARSKTHARRDESAWRMVGVLALSAAPLVHFMSILATSTPQASAVFAFGNIARWPDIIFSPTVPMQWSRVATEDIPVHIGTIVLLLATILLSGWTGSLRLDRRMRWVLLLGLLVVLLMPWRFAGVSWTHTHFPLLLIAMLIAAIEWKLASRSMALLAVAILTVFAVRTEVTKRNWVDNERDVRALVAGAAVLPAGARLITTYSTNNVYIDLNSHTAALIGIEKGAFIPFIFNGANPLMPRPPYREYVGPQELLPELSYLLRERDANIRGESIPLARGRYWAHWPEKFNYFLNIGDPGEGIERIGEFADLVAEGARFALFRIRDGN